jgi:hypothetical protein
MLIFRRGGYRDWSGAAVEPRMPIVITLIVFILTRSGTFGHTFVVMWGFMVVNFKPFHVPAPFSKEKYLEIILYIISFTKLLPRANRQWEIGALDNRCNRVHRRIGVRL